VRIFLRVIAVGVALAVAAAIAAAALLPRVLESEAVRSRIQTAVDDAVGSEVRYAELDFGLFPPSLKALDVTVAGAGPEAPNLVEAEQVALRVALLPLFARAVVVESFSVKGLRARLVRTESGIELPLARGKPDAGPSTADDGSRVDIAVAGMELQDAAIVLEDRTRKPAVTWKLQDVQLRARGDSLDEPIDFDLSLALASGGRIEAAGRATLAGELDVEAKFEAVALQPARAYLDGKSELAGKLTGTVTVRGPAASPTSVEIDAVVEDGRIQLDELSLRGRLKVQAKVLEPLTAASGSFALDATAAEVRYGGMFTKPPGDAATVTGKIVDAGDGTLGFDDVRLKVRNFEATAQVRTGKRTRVDLNAPPFDLKGWDALIPALAGYELSGPVRLENLALMTAPMDVRGTVRLDGVTGVLPGRGPVRIDGTLVGAGDVVNTKNLRIVAAGENIDVTGSVRNLDRDVRYDVKLATARADTNRLVSTFTSKRDFVYGLLTANGDFRGTISGARPPLEALQGSASIDIEKGRLKGVSLLQLTFDRFGALAGVAQIASALLGGPDLSPFYEDDFREIKGTFDVRDGIVRTDDLRIAYRDYLVELRGRLRLTDLGVDMVGRITIGERIQQSLKRAPGASNTIELGRVTGTLDEPKVHVSPEVATAFLGQGSTGSAIDKAIDDAVGEEVGDILQSILGGATRRR